MKPQPRWQTWREKQQSPAVGWRAGIVAVLAYAGSIVVGIVLLVITIAIALVVLAFFLGAFDRQIGDILSTPPLPTLAGIGLIAFAAWALYRVATGHSAPGTPIRAKVLAVVLMILLAVGGAAIVVATLAPSDGTPAF